jgi:hypothetical protein
MKKQIEEIESILKSIKENYEKEELTHIQSTIKIGEKCTHELFKYYDILKMRDFCEDERQKCFIKLRSWEKIIKDDDFRVMQTEYNKNVDKIKLNK